ncbi:hypothetical protein IWW56_000254 [Coemansia sp. RSA 2131]|nr:hypothetical protein IWW56_000254 [Coemansia sp. RSA 2131]
MESGATDIAHVEYVAQLARHLASVPHVHIPHPRRSAIAIVIRLINSAAYPPYPPSQTPEATAQSLHEFLSNSVLASARAQILFIQRAQHDRDPWSGNIGFPGGKHELCDESDQATAERETREELGLDLREGYVHLGQLNDVAVYLLGQGTRMAVSPHVYLQTLKQTPELEVSDEVASAHWIDFGCVLDRMDHPVRQFTAKYQSIGACIAARLFPKQMHRWWFRLLSVCLGKLHYTVLPLPYTSEYSVTNNVLEAGTNSVRVSDHVRFASDTELYLWGISLCMVSELVDMSLPVAPQNVWSVASPWPQLGSWLWTDVNWMTNSVHRLTWTTHRRKPWTSQSDFFISYFRTLSIAFPVSCAAKLALAIYVGRFLFKI